MSLIETSESVNLISFDDKEGIFVFTKEAEQYLNSIPNDISLGIISIVGKKLTGKSYFLNNSLFKEKQPSLKIKKKEKSNSFFKVKK